MNSYLQPELLGHDCPLGVYPSIVVPVLYTSSGVAVAYWSESQKKAQLVIVNEGATYERHSEDMRIRLMHFNYESDGLFAFSQRDIWTYKLNETEKFLEKLLRSRGAGRIDPFYRLSLARQTEDRDLIDKCFDTAVRMMRVDCPQFAAEWIRRNTPSHRSPDDLTHLWQSSSEESAIMKLLHDIYGFKYNRHRNGMTSWDWIENNQFIVRSLVSWRYQEFDLENVSLQLGLEPAELVRAAKGGYSKSFLLLILFISQVRGTLDTFGSQKRADLVRYARSILQNIIEKPLAEHERRLFSSRRDKIREIADSPDTASIGQEILRLISE